MKNCPTCQSDQIKKVSLIHAEGLSVSVGVGIGTGGAGVGAGVSASALAAACAPPKKDKDAFFKQTGSWLLLIFFVPLLMATFAAASFSDVGFFWKAWAGLGFMLIAWLNYKFDQTDGVHFKQQQTDYEKKYMCLRCGSFYSPFE